ncbi:sugar ABC transporter substrate-binding protein [Actinobacteria bacterium YIM 96077]|uniref:Sugar ABC transporter substrate-binding protein n=1 Tax=Phytoactinopolyspora halophila TaxID=1981511 RepID=A0A329QAP4_9ACTN|nr:sugar ABC transporter substrate-binding protein [Phytoactinopolyspora halophila]AYY12495.1 sugar ABC transporter substrate-binding protein [Actinobacteria bacterium YIM 96077]RAW09445.1 sugar ABC transporter substrate-binding protein [Phytoactinopolyspora halophila]
MRRTRVRIAAGAVAVPLVVAACGGGGGGDASADGEITYWLWDANQLPAYEACADAFHESGTDVRVTIEQYGWEDYWDQVTTSLVGGTAPDVFTNHLSRYPQFAAEDQLLAIGEYVERDGIDTSIYHDGLAELWVGQDGQRYGLPKDWDTVAVFYNEEMLADAGLTPEDMAELDWNPDDGGSYEEVIAKLTVDENGNRGDEPDFDPDNVDVYGIGLNSAGEGFGQTEWSMYAFSNGWTHTDQNPWGSEFNYDDPAFVETIDWWRGLIEKGYMPSFEMADAGVSMMEQYGAGNYAMVTEGSWNVSAYVDLEGVDTGLAPTPVGPEGERASMFNGLADSIWAGTDEPEAAWEWVKFLASPECQDIVAEHAVVFPAIEESTERAVDAFAEKDIDIAPFTVHVDEETTYLAPVTDEWAEVSAIMGPTMDSIVSFSSDTDALTEANEQVNALFE